jgi:hypothetical protein
MAHGRHRKGTDELNYFFADQLCIRPAYREALSILHLHNHSAVEVFFNFFQAVDVDDRTSMYTNEDLRIEDLLEFSDSRRANKLIVLRCQDGVVSGGFQVYDFIDRKIE